MVLGTDVSRAQQLRRELADRGAHTHLPADYTLADVFASHLEVGYRVSGTNLYLEWLSGLPRGVLAALPALPRVRVGALLTKFIWQNMVTHRWRLSTAAKLRRCAMVG